MTFVHESIFSLFNFGFIVPTEPPASLRVVEVRVDEIDIAWEAPKQHSAAWKLQGFILAFDQESRREFMEVQLAAHQFEYSSYTINL